MIATKLAAMSYLALNAGTPADCLQAFSHCIAGSLSNLPHHRTACRNQQPANVKHVQPLMQCLQADSEYLLYQYNVDASRPSFVDPVVRIAQVKNHSSLVISDTQLLSNEAKGAGGAVYVTSQAGVYILCKLMNSADKGRGCTVTFQTSRSANWYAGLCKFGLCTADFNLPSYAAVS